jgi:replicative superfamily II helicase
MFRGLFVGIDRYHPPVNRLTCAAADAVALSALFDDTVDGDLRCVTDAEATRAGLAAEFAHLEQAAEDDVVIVSFSGHGTDDHRLVPVDVDVADLAGTCISLEQLAEWLDDIPCKQLIVFLDCCFSGGFGGARVFSQATARSIAEDRSALSSLARGSGRVVFTASGAGEPALETAATGHGLFTHQLLQALQGAAGAPTAGRLSLLEIADYVTARVMDEAQRLRAVQTPTMYGSIEGAPSLPVLVPGSRYAAAFPDRVRSPVTADWSSLTAAGFTPELVAQWSAAMPAGLNRLQQDAINRYGVLDGKSLLVVAPTGAGKTMIGELAAFKAVGESGRAVMLLPLRALVNDKYEALTSLYGKEATIVRATGEHSDQVGALHNGQYDLALLTYEKFLNIALGAPHVLRGVHVVIVDEAQMISDEGRGPQLEFLLALLRSGYARGAAVQIVALSAVIGETNGLERWLGGGILRTTERPIPLRESVIDVSGTRRVLEPDGSETVESAYVTPVAGPGSQSSKPWIIPLTRRLIDEGKQVIVFRSTRGETVGTAQYLADALGLTPADSAISRLPTGDTSTTSSELRQSLVRGVGFHNSDLDRDERAVLEADFRDPRSSLKVLVATTTLAMGINTPAEAVVIAGLTHPGPKPYTVAEYKNMAGRAGRLGLGTVGESFIIATGDIGPGDAWARYVRGVPEGVRSHFLDPGTDPKTLVLRALVALGSNVQHDELLALLDSSFALWLRQEQGLGGWDVSVLERDLAALIAAGLVDQEPDGSLTLTELGRYAGESGIEVQSVTNVASLLRFVRGPLGFADIVTVSQVTTEMDQLYVPANRRSRQEQSQWPTSLRQQGVQPGLIQGLHVGGGDPFMRTKRALAAVLFATDLPLGDIERFLLRHHRDNAAAGQIRGVSGRTRDIVDTVCRIAELAGFDVNDAELKVAGLRLEIGLPPQLVPLAEVVGASLGRGQFLSLLTVGIATPDDVRNRPDEVKQILGEAVGTQVIEACEAMGAE